MKPARGDDPLVIPNSWLRDDQAARGVPGKGWEGPVVGRLITEQTDPSVLEVHRAVDAGSADAGLPVLPPYIRRDHDEQLAREAAGGQRDGGAGVRVIAWQDPRLLEGGPRHRAREGRWRGY